MQHASHSGRSRHRSILRSWALGVLCGLFAVLGWSALADAGPFTPRATQPGDLTFEIEYAYTAPGFCRNCHGDYEKDDVEPFNTWSGSMMANSTRDPVFWAALDVANADLPGIGEYCLRCHAPKAWLDGRASAETDKGGMVIGVGDADGCGLVGNIDETTANDFEGVTCHLCHRMVINDSPPPGEEGNYLENAEYWIDDEVCPGGSEPCRHGPYDYASPPEPPHEWAYSAYHEGSQICATCHNVTNPVLTLIDESGVDTGILYPIERTYNEWDQSEYRIGGSAEATCQNCHMPDATDPDSYACIFENIDRAGDMPQHHFVGGNTWVPALLEDQYGATIDNGTGFTDTIARAEAMLESAASLELTAPPAISPGGTLDLEVKVTNLSGHKLPTGYVEGRRMWIHVEVRGDDNDLIYESGAYDPSTGELTRDSDVKVYETQRGIWNANGMNTCDHTNPSGVEQFHFVLNDCIKLDNRIPPLGFTGGDDLETQPVGYTYPETSPGSGVLVNYDITNYSIPLPGDAASPLTVSVELRFQNSSKEYIEFLQNEAVVQNFDDDCITRSPGWSWPIGLDPGERSRGEYLYWLWENIDRSSPHDMETTMAMVDIAAEIFEDGFESGDTSAWSNVIP